MQGFKTTVSAHGFSEPTERIGNFPDTIVPQLKKKARTAFIKSCPKVGMGTKGKYAVRIVKKKDTK